MIIRTFRLMLAAVWGCWMLPLGLFAQAPEIGTPAFPFTLTDTNGNAHTLDDYQGKLVVLEWTNFDCPYVQRYLERDVIQALHRSYAAREDIVWLSIVSSAPGREGHYSGAVMNERATAAKVQSDAILIDASGDVGKAYGAKTTPHLIILTPEGNIAYDGTLDNDMRGDLEGTDAYEAYAVPALEAVRQGQAVAIAQTVPFGCPIWYADVVDPRQNRN